MNKHSLRVIKKEATAQALANAAFELALERGLDGFVVEDVVQRAGYSRRTFANHYSCKEEAVVMAVETTHDINDEAAALIEQLPDSTSPLDVLYRLLKMQLTGEYIWKLSKLTALSKRHPSLEPYILSVFRRLQANAQEVLSDLFQERYPEAYTHLLAGAVAGAMLPVLDGSLNVLLPGQPEEEAPGAMAFDQYLDSVFSYLRNGF